MHLVMDVWDEKEVDEEVDKIILLWFEHMKRMANSVIVKRVCEAESIRSLLVGSDTNKLASLIK